MARRLGERGDSAHERAGDAENVDVHQARRARVGAWAAAGAAGGCGETGCKGRLHGREALHFGDCNRYPFAHVHLDAPRSDVTALPLTADDRALAGICARFARAPRIALDTEFLRERTYLAELAIVQLADRSEIALLDVLAALDLRPLAQLLVDPAVIKVVHAGRQDLEVLLPLTGSPVQPILDSQIGAGLIGLPPQIGYAELVSRLIGVQLAKGAGANLARTDWTRRPLSDAQLSYAADDVRHLLEVADRIGAELAALGRLAWWQEDCAALAEPALYRMEPRDAWQRLKGSEALSPREQVRLRALALWREEQARQHNLPRSWVLGDEALRELACRPPATIGELTARQVFREATAARNGADLLAVLGAAEAAPLEGLAQRSAARPSSEERRVLQALADCLKSVAGALGVAPEVLATQRDLKRLAQGDRQRVGALAGWRAEVIGVPLLARLDAVARPASQGAAASTNRE
jgi:ribonuclease D